MERVYIKVNSPDVRRYQGYFRGMRLEPKGGYWYTKASYPTFRSWLQTNGTVEIGWLGTDPVPSLNTWKQQMLTRYTLCQTLQTDLLGNKITSFSTLLPESPKLLKPPYLHQKQAMTFCLNQPKAALWLSMGLGKTYTAINVVRYRAKLNGVKRVLVVMPRSLFYQWETEVHTLAPEATVSIVNGTPKSKKQAIKSVGDTLTFVLIGYESLTNLLPELRAAHFDMFVLDESTKIKNPDSKRTKATVTLCKDIPYGIELTGLAYVNNPLDLYAQFLALDGTVFGENKYAFCGRYISYAKVPFGRIVTGFKHMEDLKERAHFLTFSRSKEECLDLPAKTYHTRKLELTPLQQEWYNNLVQQIEEGPELDNTLTPPQQKQVTVNYTVAMLEKITQVTAGFVKTDDGTDLFIDSPKYEELANIITESNDVFIVWARHQFVTEHLLAYLRSLKLKVELLDRRASPADRQRIKDAFKEGKIKVLILQLQSECRGNDFTCQKHAVTSVFFENTASVEERMQAEDRCHRIGMVGTAVYIDLLCENTYDEGIQLLLKNKYSIAQYIKEDKLSLLLGKQGSISLRKGKHKVTTIKTKQTEQPQAKEAPLPPGFE